VAFTISVAGNTPLLQEDGLLDLLLETGSDYLTTEAASVAADLTNYLLYSSMTLKLNTFDFALINPPIGSYELGAMVTTTDPAWTGTVVAATLADPVDLRNNQSVVILTATNARALPNDTAPFDLSDVPGDSTFKYLLEDGTSHLLLEAGTDYAGTTGVYLMEGALAYGYSGLSVRTQSATSGPNVTLGRATVQQPGLRPGNTFALTSLNQALAAKAYQITQATITWPTAQPVTQIEFGDTPATLALWAQVTAPATIAPQAPPVVIPSGPVIFGNTTTGHVTYPMGGGTVTIASSTFSVSVPSGHTLTVQVLGAIDARMIAWDNYVATPRRGVRAVLSGGIYTGAWQELPFGLTRATYDLSSAPGIALAAGTYTVSIQINTTEYNQMEVFSGWVQASVVTV